MYSVIFPHSKSLCLLYDDVTSTIHFKKKKKKEKEKKKKIVRRANIPPFFSVLFYLLLHMKRPTNPPLSTLSTQIVNSDGQ